MDFFIVLNMMPVLRNILDQFLCCHCNLMFSNSKYVVTYVSAYVPCITIWILMVTQIFLNVHMYVVGMYAKNFCLLSCFEWRKLSSLLRLENFNVLVHTYIDLLCSLYLQILIKIKYLDAVWLLITWSVYIFYIFDRKFWWVALATHSSLSDPSNFPTEFCTTSYLMLM